MGFFFGGIKMDDHWLSRTEILIGKQNIDKLSNKCVAIFGIGGVGSHAAEALARCGLGKLVLIDHDTVCLTNLNRQIHAMMSTVGKYKVDVMADRLKDINPSINISKYREFLSEENGQNLIKQEYDYIIDAIDTISSKIYLIETAKKLNIPIISCMGAGNKLDPTRFEVADIYETSVCPMAKVIRKELKKLGIKRLKVVYSKEKPIKISNISNCIDQKRVVPGSVSFVPPVAGFILAAEVIKDLIGINSRKD